MSSRGVRRIVVGAGVVAAVALAAVGAWIGTAPSEPEPFLVKRNGGWCWFQDERAIVDRGKVLVGTVAGTTRNGTSAGDVEITSFDLTTRQATTTKLHEKLQSDDHASPSVVRLADGRYLSAYTTHGKDRLMRWRVTESPGDATSWRPEQTLRLGANVTYTNLALEPGDGGRLFNFFRGHVSPGLLVATPSPAGDVTFADAGPWIAWTRSSPSFDPAKSTRTSDPKPYLRFASRNGRVHVLLSEDHPRAYDNSIYHGYFEGHVLHDSAGAVLDDDVRSGDPIELTRLTRVYEGDRDNVAWAIDLEVDAEGHPFGVFITQKDGQGRSSKKDLGGHDHRLHVARFDGKAWRTHEIAHAGSMLYKHEVNYTGLAALVPGKPDVMFLSANVDPATGRAVAEPRRFEMYRGASADGGRTWRWRQLTRDSAAHNIRPIVPPWDGGTLVLWLRGSYQSMARYDLDVVGLLDPGQDPG